MNRILIIEDDPSLCEELSVLLEKAGYSVQSVKDFTDVCAQMLSAEADLILLDINLPEENGEMLLQKFRRRSDTPVMMLTSRSGDIDEVVSMSYGADDYITKPYNPTILLLRISAVLKRSAKTGQSQTYKGVLVSAVRGSLAKDGQERALTKNEMLIFQMLLEHQGEIVSRDDLMTLLWDNDEYINDNALSVNISRLRAKLSELGLADVIETRKKQGYRLQ